MTAPVSRSLSATVQGAAQEPETVQSTQVEQGGISPYVQRAANEGKLVQPLQRKQAPIATTGSVKVADEDANGEIASDVNQVA
mgnify:CR=1 FL=1